MKARVTVSIARDVLEFVDVAARRKSMSRSELVEEVLRSSRKRIREVRLARQARQFFERAPTKEEAEERMDWLKLSAETFRRDR